ncbi:LuxR C-terminal-related transcriptional regulator [Saccharopolyspora tripterygii]
MSSATEAHSDLERLRSHRRHARRERAFIARFVWAVFDELEQRNRETAAEPGWSRKDLEHWAEIAEERRAARAHDLELRRTTDATLAAALDRLASAPSSGEMSRRAPAELREACGFTRVMISSARGSRWLPDTIRPEDYADPDADEFDRFAREGNEIPLARSMLETEMVRHRKAVIVEHAETDPRTYKPLVRVTQSRSYVAAPITTNRRVIGFLHADRLRQDSQITVGDLHSIDLFAAEFSVLFESAVLRERIDGQRARVGELLSEVTAGLAALAEEPLALPATAQERARGEEPGPSAAQRTADLLSRREQEVLTLLAAGATNRAIAQELVLSSETVKSHVSKILRKLRVATRSEAVAKYLQLRELETREAVS